MLTILHASDLQAGKPYRPWAAEALFRLADRMRPDLVVIAGDLTQRARAAEYRLARGVMGRLSELLPGAPVVVTPGNHDVPLYRIWERLAAPYRNWKRAVADDLDSVTHVPGTTVVALNSSSPYRGVVGGRLTRDQLGFAREAFEGGASGDLRILVTHHHFMSPPDGLGGRPLPGSARILATLEEIDVDLVLGGHVHQTHITSSRDVLVDRPGPGIPLVACGTTASGRGRGPEVGINSLNVVRLEASEIEITPHVLAVEGAEFEARDPIRVPRPGIERAAPHDAPARQAVNAPVRQAAAPSPDRRRTESGSGER